MRPERKQPLEELAEGGIEHDGHRTDKLRTLISRRGPSQSRHPRRNARTWLRRASPSLPFTLTVTETAASPKKCGALIRNTTPTKNTSRLPTTQLHLQEHFETLVPMGYENDCGGFGDVVLDVAARKITVERNDRFEDYTTSTYEI